MKTKEELREETIKFYEEDPTRYSGGFGGCYYFKDGKKCAIGRLLSDEEAQKLEAFYPLTGLRVVWSKERDIKDNYPELLQLVGEYGIDYLCELQRIHDSNALDYYYSSNGLTR